MRNFYSRGQPNTTAEVLKNGSGVEIYLYLTRQNAYIRNFSHDPLVPPKVQLLSVLSVIFLAVVRVQEWKCPYKP